VLLMGADAFSASRLASLARSVRAGPYRRGDAGLQLSLADLPAELPQPARNGSTISAACRTAPTGRVVQFAMTPWPFPPPLRARLAAGLSARYLLPDPVREYIDRQQLYRN
jgi:nicotinate-nucleotide adenylyltransferase